MESIFVASPPMRLPDPPASPAETETADLLRQLIELQREHLAIAKAARDQPDEQSKWQSFFDRHAGDFPGLIESCREVLPQIERAYLSLARDAAEHLLDRDDALSSDFGLSDFLDRFAPRLAQLGQTMGQVGHLAGLAPKDAS